MRCVSFLADDRYVASADENKSVIIWDIRTGFPVHRFYTETFVTGFWQDPDSGILWIGEGSLYSDSIMESRYNLEKGEPIPVDPDDFSPEPPKAAEEFLKRNTSSMSWRETTELGRAGKVFAGVNKVITSEEVSFDGRQALLGLRDGTVQLWDLEKQKLIRSFGGELSPVDGIAASEDGRMLATWTDGTQEDFRFWDLHTLNVVQAIIPERANITSAVFTGDGSICIAELRSPDDLKHYLVLFDTESGNPIFQSEEPTHDLWSSLWISPDDKTLVSAQTGYLPGAEMLITLWNLEAKKIALFKRFGKVFSQSWSNEGGDSPLTRMVITPNHPQTLSISNTPKESILVDINTSTEITPLPVVGTGKVVSLDVSRDGKYLVTGTNHRGISEFNIFNLRTEKKELKYDFESLQPAWDEVVGLTATQFCDGTDYLLVAGVDGETSVNVFDIEMNQIVGKWEDIQGGENRGRFGGTAHWEKYIDEMVVSSDAKRVFVVSPGRTVKVLEIGKEGSLTQTAELAAFSDGEWAVTLVDGHYASSPRGANNLYYLNQGVPRWYENLEVQFNRPDRVSKTFGGNAGQIEILTEARNQRIQVGGTNAEPAPRFNRHEVPTIDFDGSETQLLRSPNDQYPLCFKATSRNSKLAYYHVKINGVPFSGFPGVFGSKSEHAEVSKFLGLEGGLINRIKFWVVDEEGRSSKKINLSVYCEEENLREAEIYVVCVGVSDYADDRLDLTVAHRDANSVGEWFRDQSQFARCHSEIIVNREATKLAIRRRISRFLSNARPNDVVVLFFAGHGFTSPTGYQFGSHDIDPDNPEGGLSFNEIENLLMSTAARKRLVLMDTCFAGLTPTGVEQDSKYKNLTKGVRAFVPEFAKQHKGDEDNQSWFRAESLFGSVGNYTGASVITGSSGVEFVFALESDSLQNGVFTTAILEGLCGIADSDFDEVITVSELQKYTRRRVSELTGELQRTSTRGVNMNLDFGINRPALSGVVPPNATFIEHYLELSKRNGDLTQLGSLFDSEVQHFGKLKSREAVLEEESDYHNQWFWREFDIVGPVKLVNKTDTKRVFRYQIQFVKIARREKSEKLQVGKGISNCEMTLTKKSGQWLITGLKSY